MSFFSHLEGRLDLCTHVQNRFNFISLQIEVLKEKLSDAEKKSLENLEFVKTKETYFQKEVHISLLHW